MSAPARPPAGAPAGGRRAAADLVLRAMRPGDEAAVASLWQYWFRDKTRVPEPGLAELARRLYLEHPNADGRVPSLVAESREGAMLGFLGAVPTPVVLDGERALLAGVFPPVVDPAAPGAVASFLLRRFLAGPQALTFSDGGHVKYEPIWEALGGNVAQLQSLRWVKLLRPLELGAAMLTGRGGAHEGPASGGAGEGALLGLARAATARGPTGDGREGDQPQPQAWWALAEQLTHDLLMPPARGGDWLARRLAPARLRGEPPAARPRGLAVRRGFAGWHVEPLTPEALPGANAAVHAGARLRPDYTPEYARWLFAEMALAQGQGSLQARLVRGPRGEMLGWYVYFLRPGGVCRVFALEADERHLDDVIDRLFAEADAGGGGALIGRLAPRLRRPMAARGCLVYAGGSLQMVHAHDRRLMDDFQLGRLAVTRLEGENWYWWRIVGRPVGARATPAGA